MLETAIKIDEELLLRKHAVIGDFQQVQEILNRNKTNRNFNINAQSSNGNTALHWACLDAKKYHKGFSEKYCKIIRLLIENGADSFLKNKLGALPLDFLQGMHVEVSGSKDLSSQNQDKDSCYFAFITALLRRQCEKITTSEELEGELAGETAFYFIIDSLKLVRFFPKVDPSQEKITILSLACGIATEIFPLMIYFQSQNKQLNYIGIDNNEEIIKDNIQKYAAFENVKFICADAANLSEITTHIAPNSIDMGILRNGDFTETHNRQKIFCKIIDEIFPSLLKPDFPLLVSFQTETELQICKQKTQILQNFKQFKDSNFCDIGTLCRIFGKYRNENVFAYSDRFTAILNLEETDKKQQMQLSDFSKLSM